MSFAQNSEDGTLVNPERLRRILSKMFDEDEFLSPYGIRSISKFHKRHPYILHACGREYRVDYLPAESNKGMFGGNSHWRDFILFYEYFHGDNGAGLGASHQTGWTGVIAKLIQLFGVLDPGKSLETGKKAGFTRRK